jgi:RNA polymerase sigma-70 factor (ECF subfamily)
MVVTLLQEDLKLVQAVLARDRKATAELVERWADTVYAYVRSRLFPREDRVDDLVQDVFLTAWEKLATFRGEAPLRAWLVGIARHKVEDYYRSLLAHPLMQAESESEEPMDETPSLDDRLDQDRLELRMRQVLQQLPEAYTAALLWRYWEKRSAREIAASTGRTEKAVERLLARAREQFRRRWME